MAYTSSHRISFRPVLTPWVKRLLIANVVVFFLTMLAPEFILEWFAFNPSRILSRPWGTVTYMFLHGGFWHLFMNMLVLFFFGPSLEARMGSTEFIRFYLVCGLGGVALSFIFAPSWIIGASAAVYGLMLAFAMTWPDAPIYIWGIFPVKAKWLVTFLFVVSLFSAFGGAGGGIAHFAHLGGLLAGFVYLKGGGRVAERLGEWKKFARVDRLEVTPRDEGGGEAEERKTRSWSREEDELLDEVDRILDKISAHGMSSLTREEREVLDRVSRSRRSN